MVKKIPQDIEKFLNKKARIELKATTLADFVENYNPRSKIDKKDIRFTKILAYLANAECRPVEECVSCSSLYLGLLKDLTQDHCPDCAMEKFYGDVSGAVDYVLYSGNNKLNWAQSLFLGE